LKEQFSAATSRAEQLHLLTILPNIWSKSHIENEFILFRFLSEKAKQLVIEKSNYSWPGKSDQQQQTEKFFVQFYNSDQIIRNTPGKNDSKSVLRDACRLLVQKRLVFCNLKEAFQRFKELYPVEKIGMSTFCKPTTARVYHSITKWNAFCLCLYECMIHENVNLKFTAISSADLPFKDV
jgi:hypothetical protein